jgi:hypothetical protein
MPAGASCVGHGFVVATSPAPYCPCHAVRLSPSGATHSCRRKMQGCHYWMMYLQLLHITMVASTIRNGDAEWSLLA